MFQATRIIQSKSPKIPLLINCEGGVTTNEQEQVKNITFFSNFFGKEHTKELLDIQPCEMQNPFTAEEITLSIKKLKNNKSPGIDQVKAEHLKHSPQILSKYIADILNETAKTGKNIAILA